MYLKYKYPTEDAQKDIIIPRAADAPPIKVTVLYEYFTERILETGPALHGFSIKQCVS